VTEAAAVCVEAGCEHVCRVKADEIESAECFCRDGYVLAEDGKSCEDVNECSADGGNGGCKVYCRNLAGSYECLCRLGYSLDINGKTCQGELQYRVGE
jgi:fibulin 1/2